MVPCAWLLPNGDTLADLYMAIRWAFAAGLSGQFPDRNHLNEELRPGRGLSNLASNIRTLRNCFGVWGAAGLYSHPHLDF